MKPLTVPMLEKYYNAKLTATKDLCPLFDVYDSDYWETTETKT